MTHMTTARTGAARFRKERTMKYSFITILLSTTGLLITALVTTTAGQVALAAITSNLYTWFAGEPFYMTIWKDPFLLLEVWF